VEVPAIVVFFDKITLFPMLLTLTITCGAETDSLRCIFWPLLLDSLILLRESLLLLWPTSVKYATEMLIREVLVKVAIKLRRLTLLTLPSLLILDLLVSNCEDLRDPSIVDMSTLALPPLLVPSVPTYNSLPMPVSWDCLPLSLLTSTLPETLMEITRSKPEPSMLGKELVSLAFSVELLVTVFALSLIPNSPSAPLLDVMLAWITPNAN
jgi:hypothetical protein